MIVTNCRSGTVPGTEEIAREVAATEPCDTTWIELCNGDRRNNWRELTRA